MPKRMCPFPETFSSQYKIHIRQQELDNYGVFGSKHRQAIYEKTKNLLFNGTKAVMGKIWTSEEGSGDQQPSGHVETSSCQTLLRGQMLIGQDGKLMKANAAQNENLCLSDVTQVYTVEGERASVAPTCCCVCQKSQRSRTSCSQCDRLACSSCLRQCSSCSSLCCSVCTITDYSGQYDEVLCCGCSS